MKVLFSVIIPHYNDIDGLSRLLKSIPLEDAIQVIVVDDNSTNIDFSSLEMLCNDYNASLFKNTSANKGAGACRNIALSNAKGERLIFADADDFFTDGAFDVIKNTVKKPEAENVDVIYFSPTSIYSDTGELANRHVPYEELVDKYIKCQDQAIRYQYFVPWSKVIRKDFVEQNTISFDEVIASNDVMFATKAGSLAKQIFVSSDTIYCVTRQKGSLTTKTNNYVRNTRLEVLIRYNEYLYRLNMKQYQDSFYGIVKEYFKAMDSGSFKALVRLAATGKIPVLPRTYSQYLTSPSTLLKRLSNKKVSHHKDKKYLD